mgnify:CR=1 FL=1
MYQSPKEHVKSRISPGTIIKFRAMVRRSTVAVLWYAIHLYESQFYVIGFRLPARIMTLSDHTLLRAHLDDRLEIIEQ